MDPNQKDKSSQLSENEKYHERDNDDIFSSIDDSSINNLCEMLALLKEEKKKLGFMEYFFAGYMYAKGFNDVNNIKTKLEDSKLWSHKMKLSFKQKVLMMMLKIDEPDSNKLNKRQTKQNAKQIDAAEDIKLLSYNKVNEETKYQKVSKQDQHISRTEQLHQVQQADDSQHFLNNEDTINIVPSLKSNFVSGSQSIENDVVGECKICLHSISMAELYCLDCCANIFHRDCIRKHFEVSIDSSKIPLMCPIIKCKAEILVDSVFDLLNKSYIDRLDKFVFKLTIMKNSQKYLSCPTPGCDYVLCVEKNDRKGFFKCPSCTIEYCLNCEAPFHDGINCDEYQQIYGKGMLDFDDQQAIDHALVNSMKRCPKCKMWVFREEGCDNMS